MCERRAEQALAGRGAATLGEWREWTGTAFHLRRRLRRSEQVSVGPVEDIRGTDEARQRAAALGPRLRYVPPEVRAAELGA
jgi:hypothetical protein